VITRSGFKAGVHAILAKQGLHLPVKELFGPRGRAELAAAPLDRVYRARLNAYLRIVDTLSTEIVLADGWIAARLHEGRGVSGDPADLGCGSGVGGGVRRRDRRHYAVRLGAGRPASHSADAAGPALLWSGAVLGHPVSARHAS
jgi:hypothetical protein